MSPEQATRYLEHIRVEGDEVKAVFAADTPAAAVMALRSVRQGIVFLADAAVRAGCDEPLTALVREFRLDLSDFAAGEWSVVPVVDAIETVGAMDGWQFSKRGVA